MSTEAGQGHLVRGTPSHGRGRDLAAFGWERQVCLTVEGAVRGNWRKSCSELRLRRIGRRVSAVLGRWAHCVGGVKQVCRKLVMRPEGLVLNSLLRHWLLAHSRVAAGLLARSRLMLVLAMALPSCMTTVNQVGYWSDSSVGHMTDPKAVVYGGTRADANALWNLATSMTSPGGSGGSVAARLGWGALCVIDLPLSLVADTLLLPLTLSEAWWLRAHRSQGGSVVPA